MLRIFRLGFIVLVVFATTALYIQGQWVFHNHENGWWEAIRMVITENFFIAIPAFVIIGFFIWIEWLYQKREDKKNEAMLNLLKAIAKKLGTEIDEPRSKKTKGK